MHWSRNHRISISTAAITSALVLVAGCATDTSNPVADPLTDNTATSSAGRSASTDEGVVLDLNAELGTQSSTDTQPAPLPESVEVALDSPAEKMVPVTTAAGESNASEISSAPSDNCVMAEHTDTTCITDGIEIDLTEPDPGPVSTESGIEQAVTEPNNEAAATTASVETGISPTDNSGETSDAEGVAVTFQDQQSTANLDLSSISVSTTQNADTAQQNPAPQTSSTFAFKRPAGSPLDSAAMSNLVEAGTQAWEDANLGANGLSCASCHTGTALLQTTFAQPYPHEVKTVAERTGITSIDIDEMVNYCVTQHMQGEPLRWNSVELLSLSGYALDLQKAFGQ